MLRPTTLFEDNHLLVVHKPSGMATSGVKDSLSVYAWAGEYLKKKYNKPGNVFVGIVSRLDTMTSGVLVLARTSKAASRLSEQIRLHEIEKDYLAVVEGHLGTAVGEIWVDQLYKDDAAHRMRVLSDAAKEVPTTRNGKSVAGKPEPQEARLQIEAIQRFRVGVETASAVSVKLITGRKHQIRVQFASRGHAVWGDRKYGAKTPELRSGNNRGIALHASTLTITHPTLKQRMTFTAPVPETWKCFGRIDF